MYYNIFYFLLLSLKLLDRCADGVMFGALDFCPECENGRLILRYI